MSVIDLGFNSAKMVNYEIKNKNVFKAYEQEGSTVRLGEGMNKTGILGEPARLRTIEALKLFRDIINFQQIRDVIPFATSAVREADNRVDFIRQVYRETGFKLKILSEREEALYSYSGAIKATCMPTALFFDLGGGSLEIIYSENYRIKKVSSVSLGALRLSQMFAKKDGTFGKKEYEKMEGHILKNLPDKKDLDLDEKTGLVGVGGSLRALSRYDQEARKYPLDKIHNYKMGFESMDNIARTLSDMPLQKIGEIEAVGKNRTETIAAGSCVIRTLMKKYGFSKITVSAHGLREGVLSSFLESRRLYYTAKMDQAQIQKSARFACDASEIEESLLSNCLIELLRKKELLRYREYRIFLHAYRILQELPQITNVNNLFFMIIDEDSSQFSHVEQLILALSIIQTRKTKAADWLFKRYKSILQQKDKESVAKIAACIVVSGILEQTKSQVKITAASNEGRIKLKVLPAKNGFPSLLFKDAVKRFEHEFDISLDVNVEPAFHATQSRIVKTGGTI